MRIAIGCLQQESNTFSPFPTGIETFRANYLLKGEEIFAGLGGARVEVPGMLAVLQEAGAEPVPLIATHALAGGAVTRAALDELLGELLARLKAALPVDAVLLALHGAMVLEDDSDADGAILAAVREVVGPEVPVAASLDLHGHITQRMLDHADILVGYHCYPHIDMYETGQRTARWLLEMLAGKVKPALAMGKRHMVLSPNGATTVAGPFKRLMEQAVALEQGGEVLAASLFPVQPWLDIPDLGYAALVMTDGDPEGAKRIAQQLAADAWAVRDQFDPDLVPLAEAIRRGMAADGLTVIGDSGDATTGGAPGDSAAVLKELLAQGVDRTDRLAYLTLVDPEAVQAAERAGIGAEVTMAVGHKVDRRYGEPLTVTGRVLTLCEGRYRVVGPGATGAPMNMGHAAVLAIGPIRLLLMTYPVSAWDASAFLAVGLDPRAATLLFAKSPSHFRVYYTTIARQIFNADTPGPTCCNMRSLTFTRVTRPLYPFDEQ
jgi:microcystin degradation protein MlrC